MEEGVGAVWRDPLVGAAPGRSNIRAHHARLAGWRPMAGNHIVTCLSLSGICIPVVSAVHRNAAVLVTMENKMAMP